MDEKIRKLSEELKAKLKEKGYKLTTQRKAIINVFLKNQSSHLSPEEIYTLLENLNNIYNIHYRDTIKMTKEHIRMYMEEQLNRPGADEFLTPRAVIKDFLEILDLIRQNPNESVKDIIYIKFGKKPTPVSKDSDNKDDEIEVL